MRSCFSIGYWLSLKEMSFGCTWSPTSTWITLSSIGGLRCSKHFSYWRSSCWAHGSASKVPISSFCSTWQMNIMLAKRFLILPPYWHQNPNWMSLMITMVGTHQTLILTEKEEWHILTPCSCGRNSWLVFFPVRRVAKACAALYQNSNHHHDLGCNPFFSLCGMLTVHNERIVGFPSRRLIL